jgi:hypothetical protein
VSGRGTVVITLPKKKCSAWFKSVVGQFFVVLSGAFAGIKQIGDDIFAYHVNNFTDHQGFRRFYSGANHSTVHVFWASKMFGGKKSIKSALERPKGEKNRIFGLKTQKELSNFCHLYEKITLHSQNDMLHIGSDVVKAEIYVHIIW